MAGCGECYFGGKKIGHKGPIESPFVIIGESPGALELARGKPFIGPAGTLLDSVLAPYIDKLTAAGYEPFTTCAINCLPRQKDADKLSTACNRCAQRVKDELALHPRKVILALGNAALWQATGNHGLKITQVRGKLFKTPNASVGTMAAVHPSFLLRGGGNLDQFRRDMEVTYRLVMDEPITDELADPGSDTSGGKKNNPWKKRSGIRAVGQFKHGTYDVLETPEEVAELCVKLKDVEYAAADFETDGFDPRKGSLYMPPGNMAEGILCLGVCFERGHSYVIPGPLLTNRLFENKTLWCWQNGKFDVSWGKAYGMPDIRVDDDTMLLSYLLNEQGGLHDLEQLGADWLQATDYKDMISSQLPSKKHSYAHIPKDILYKYQAIDAELTFWLRDVLRSRVMADKHLSKVYTDILIPASDFLYHVEHNGFMIDTVKIQENTERLGGIADIEEAKFIQLAEEVGIPGINIRSPKQVAPFLYDNLGLAKSGTGTGIDILEMLPKHPAVESLKGYRKVHKLLSTFVKPLGAKADEQNRLHSTFKLHGTTTGRLSSSKPNLQNIPRDPDIRGQFIAGPGRAILEVDLSQAELRVLACLAQDEAMIRIFRSGVSLHDELAEYLFGKGFGKEQKMIAKNINFGIIYGITPYGLLDQIEIGAMRLGSDIHVNKQQCKEWIRGWFERFPEAKDFLDRCCMAPVKGLTLVSVFGRKRRFKVVGREKMRDMQNEAMNFPEQSAAHDITLLAGIEVRASIEQQYGALIVNEVHDALLTDIADDMSVIVPCANRIKQTMERIPKEWGLTEIPFTSEAEVGIRWGSCHTIPDEILNTDPLELKGISHADILKTD